MENSDKQYERYIGKTLDERYSIVNIIGIGGMAAVFGAFDMHTGQTVALKMLRSAKSSESSAEREQARKLVPGMISVERSRNSIFCSSVLPSEEWCSSFLAGIQVSAYHFPAYFHSHIFLFSPTGIFSSQTELVASQTGHVLPPSSLLCVVPTLGMRFLLPPWAHAVPNSGWHLSGLKAMVRKQQKMESAWI